MFIQMLLVNDYRQFVSLQTSWLAQLRIVSRNIKCSRTRLPPGLRRRSAVARLLRSWVFSPPGGMDVCLLLSVVCEAHRSFVWRSHTECVYVSLSVIVCNNNSVHIQ